MVYKKIVVRYRLETLADSFIDSNLGIFIPLNKFPFQKLLSPLKHEF